MNWREAIVVAVISLALIGIGAGVAEAQWNNSARFLDQKQIGDMFAAMQSIAANQDAKRKLSRADKELCGRGFFEYGFQNKLFDMDMLKKCVSMRSLAGDERGDGKFAETGEGEMKQSECSYATPKTGTLLATLGLRGKNKRVGLCFDSRNWQNGGKAGVLVSWTDGEMGAYLDAKTLMDEFKISAEDLGDPGGKVLGKLAPFDRVFEEQASADAAEKVREDIKKLPSFVEVFKKKERSWKYKGTSDEKHAPLKEFQVFVKVLEVEGNTAKWVGRFLDAKGNSLENGPEDKVDSLDLTDDLDQRPPGQPSSEVEEIEAADRKWKCVKWTYKEGDVTTCAWMSVEFPGLMVKGEGRINLTLIEFNDPK